MYILVLEILKPGQNMLKYDYDDVDVILLLILDLAC